MVDCGAEFVARSLATDRQLDAVITSAIKHPGFALVEIVELCTEHATGNNSLTGKALERIVKSQNQQLGILIGSGTRTEFAARYADKYPRQSPEISGEEIFVTPLFKSSLAKQVGIVIAGSAGERVQSSARKLCQGAMRSGLYCTQKNDNPVTQGSGFSISEVIISPNEIFYTGIDIPDVVIAVSKDGLQELEEKQIVTHLTPTSVFIIDSELNGPTTSAQTYTYPFRKEYGAEKAAARAVEFYLRLSSLFSVDSLTS
jgi:hypothetical protein